MGAGEKGDVIRMDAKSVKWARLGLIAATVAIAAMVLVPTAAFAAKAKTRIVVTSQRVVNWNSGASATAPTVSVKLQKKKGSKWVALKGPIKAYWYNQRTGWAYQGSLTTSILNATLNTRGRYRFSYAGSKTAKSCLAYTKRIDTIGDTVSAITAVIAPIDDTWTGVTVSYDVGWNTNAYPFFIDHLVQLAYTGTFRDDSGYYSGDVSFLQEVAQPGTVQFSYRVRTADIPDGASLVTTGMVMSFDDYIRTTSESDDVTAYTPPI